MQLIVTANKLNKRSSVPTDLSEKNIVGTVLKGFRFDGEEVTNLPNPSIGKWYVDRDNSYYWGGGLIVENNQLSEPTHNFSIPGLPINLPENCTIGADLSHYNNVPDWQAVVDAGISFIYIKISDGVGDPDTKAKEHANNARLHGLQIGYYHFCRPDKKNGGTTISDATTEADEAIKIVALLPEPQLPLVFDVEAESPLDKTDYLLWVNTFVARIKDKTGASPMIYSYKSYLDEHLTPSHGLGNMPLWLANYSHKDCNNVPCPVGWNDWAMWQFSESAIIGRNSKMDLSIKKT